MPRLPPVTEGDEGNPASFDAASIFKSMRAVLGLSQERFAELVGMKRQQVSAYENGHHSATIDTLARGNATGWTPGFIWLADTGASV